MKTLQSGVYTVAFLVSCACLDYRFVSLLYHELVKLALQNISKGQQHGLMKKKKKKKVLVAKPDDRGLIPKTQMVAKNQLLKVVL